MALLPGLIMIRESHCSDIIHVFSSEISDLETQESVPTLSVLGLVVLESEEGLHALEEIVLSHLGLPVLLPISVSAVEAAEEVSANHEVFLVSGLDGISGEETVEPHLSQRQQHRGICRRSMG